VITMGTTLDFTFHKGKGHDVDDQLKIGITQVTEQLFLGGQEDVSDILPDVQVWVDLRSEGIWNRIVEIPSHVTYIRMPIVDGDAQRAKQVFLKAKQIIEMSLEAGEKVVVSCHAGVSRSVVVAWWILADQMEDAEKAWCELKMKRPAIEPDERFSEFIRENIMTIRGSQV
jgi:protein-tyrosine phosphatase